MRVCGQSYNIALRIAPRRRCFFQSDTVLVLGPRVNRPTHNNRIFRNDKLIDHIFFVLVCSTTFIGPHMLNVIFHALMYMRCMCSRTKNKNRWKRSKTAYMPFLLWALSDIHGPGHSSELYPTLYSLKHCSFKCSRGGIARCICIEPSVKYQYMSSSTWNLCFMWNISVWPVKHVCAI